MKISNISFMRPSLHINQSFQRKNRLSYTSNDTIQFSGNSNNSAKGQLKILSELLSSNNLDTQSILNFEQSIRNLSQKEKEDFIRAYCTQTGFPNMQKTSKLIIDDITTSLLKAADDTGAEVLLAGYNPTCSVGNNHALPGSDFDTFFVCLKNWENFDEFKECFKKNVNPLLCSITRTRTNDVPDFVTIDDILSSINKAQVIFNSSNLNQKSSIYNDILDRQIEDWTQAGQYNLDLNAFVDDKDKTPLLRAGLLMEIYRDGAIIVDNLDDRTREKLQNSCVYNFSNMQQMRSYKSAPLKNKHANREAMLSNFDNLSTDEKLELIFNIINLSIKVLKSGVLEKYRPMFQDAGCGNMEDLMQPLLSNKHRLPEYRV